MYMYMYMHMYMYMYMYLQRLPAEALGVAQLLGAEHPEGPVSPRAQRAAEHLYMCSEQ